MFYKQQMLRDAQSPGTCCDMTHIKWGQKSVFGVIFSKQILLNLYNISLARLIELSAVKTDWYCGVNIKRDFHKMTDPHVQKNEWVHAGIQGNNG